MAHPHTPFRILPTLLLSTPMGLLMAWSTGCAPQRLERGPDYQIRAEINPPEHRLEAVARLTLTNEHTTSRLFGAREIRLLLNPALEVHRVSDPQGRRFDFGRRTFTVHESEDQPEVSLQCIRVSVPQDPLPQSLLLEYGGPLKQDISAGEKEGEIHNFLVSAHIAAEGIYLDPEGYWYPRLTLDGREPAGGLSHYSLDVHPVEGIEFVAGAEPAQAEPDDGWRHWTSPYPLDGMVLVGGPFEMRTRGVDGIEARIFLRKSEAGADSAAYNESATLFLDAVEKYLRLYQPLVGPYPMRTYNVVENFFSSGFAFPGFTLLSPEVIAMGPRSLRHGYLDHEMLHCWWGNGIHVDPEDGNWCEALASFGGNVHGFALDGDPVGLRGKRRDAANQLSQLDEKNDQPLGTYGQPKGCNRTVAYTKGAAVFDMLATQIGHDAFWRGIQRLTRERLGRYADWNVLQSAFEAESGADLETFFDQWVRRAGLPTVEIQSAAYRQGSQTLEVRCAQRSPYFDLTLPVRARFEDGTYQDFPCSLRGGSGRIQSLCARAPKSVMLDPDFVMLRRLFPDEIMPTSSLTGRSRTLTIIRASGDDWPGYQKTADHFSEVGNGESTLNVRTLLAEQLKPDDLRVGSLLILGGAARIEPVASLIKRTRWPGTFHAGGFALDDQTFDEPGHAVFGTVHHPDDAEQGVTIYYGNSADALANAGLLSFYGNSLLVFSTPAGSTASDRLHTTVVMRKDLEHLRETPVELQ